MFLPTPCSWCISGRNFPSMATKHSTPNYHVWLLNRWLFKDAECGKILFTSAWQWQVETLHLWKSGCINFGAEYSHIRPLVFFPCCELKPWSLPTGLKLRERTRKLWTVKENGRCLVIFCFLILVSWTFIICLQWQHTGRCCVIQLSSQRRRRRQMLLYSQHLKDT